MIYITKPGSTLQVVEGKSNMQLYELQVIDTICKTNKLNSELITISNLLTKDLTGCKIVVFVTIEKFNLEFAALLDYIKDKNFKNVDVILVSNDPRLTFKYDNVSGNNFDNVSFTMVTNATRRINDYKDVTFISELAEQTKVISAPLWTMPAFYLQQQPIVEKEVTSMFHCLHFNEMSDYRQVMLGYLHYELENDIMLVGADYPKNWNTLPTVDAKELPALLNKVMSIPVLLEYAHQYYGVITSRVSEALISNCIPYMIYDIDNLIPEEYRILHYGTVENYYSDCRNFMNVGVPEQELSKNIEYMNSEKLKLEQRIVTLLS
jgi:hypothetical protein